jgi:two-component system response regulator YesN
MKKVMIVDDELLVQVGLKSMINWEEHGLNVVAEAKNGQEALAAFERFDPSIVFVDIAMPEMNGLELIRILKEKKPSIKTVILTSHTDFNYVKEAASLSVSEYLLKSELTRDNLAKCIHNILNQIETEASDENKNDGSFSINSGHLVEDDLFKIITGFYKSQEEMEAIIDKYKFSFKKSIWFVSIAQFLIKDNDMERYQKDPGHFNTVILGLSKQAFSERDFIVYSAIINNEKIIFLFNIDISKDIPVIKEKIMTLLYLFKSNLKQFLNIDLCVGVSGSAEFFRQLPELYKQAYNAKEFSFFEKDKIVAYDESLFQCDENLPKINYKAIEKLLLKRDMEELEKTFDHIFSQLYSCKNKEYVRTVFIDLLSQAKVFVEPLRNVQDTLALSDVSFNYNLFQKLYVFDDVKNYINDIYKKVIKMGENQGQEQYSYSIQKSIEYIKKNYKKNFTLSDVAKYADVSKNYLSFLFKQEIGTNFSVFLLNFRINKSKELLTNGNAKIYEIADMVGFGNPYYFSKVFRETVGISCREYQKLYYESR